MKTGPIPGLHRLSFGAVAFCLFAGPAFAGIPDWLAAAARQSTPANCGAANGVVLLEKTILAVDESGSVSTTRRVAVRLLTKQGANLANATATYIDKTERVRVNSAWLIRSGKTVKQVLGKEWQDIAAASTGAIYNEYRIKAVDCSDQAIPDDVFGYETVVEGKPVFSQFSESFGGSLPALEKKFQITVPEGWSIQAAAENNEILISSISADRRSQSWSQYNRSYRPAELWAAPVGISAPFVYGSYAPREKLKSVIPQFRSWGEVASWKLKLSEPQCDSDQNLKDMAQQLIAGCSDDTAKIRAICRYVQNLQYVAINRNLGIGFGYRPRKATEIVAKGFGDCKDKVNALRSLLREAGLRSHPITVLLDDENVLWPAWPSPLQFNHVIIGIEVKDSLSLATELSTETWGRLLVFDPTDPYTPLGGLPWLLQGSKALVNAAGSESLVVLPVLTSERDWLVSRQVELKLSANGAVSGRTSVISFGQAGVITRAWLRSATTKDLHDEAIESLAGAMLGVQVANIVSKNQPDADRCSVEYDFSAPKFAQIMAGSLAIVRLDIFGRGHFPTFAERTRETPVMLHPIEQRDEMLLLLPAGFEVVECPADIFLETPFGSFACRYEVKESKVVQFRSFSLRRIQVARTDYEAMRKFLSEVAKASQASVLLRRS